MDTGSDWTTIESAECDSCLDNHFDPEASRTYRQESDQLSELLYGSAKLKGYLASDIVSLDRNFTTAVEGFKFFEIYEQEGLPV